MRTEDVSARYADLEGWSDREVLQALWESQLAAVAALGPALPALGAAAAAAEAALRAGGRLIYVGAGTSARIAVQDGAELPPTFDWPQERLGFAVAGGSGAIFQAVEDAEDSTRAASDWIAEAALSPHDVVVGLSASGTTPFTVTALRLARERGAVTIGVANNPDAPLLTAAAHPILVATGPEVVAGSTRMKAGTAQKIVLNLLSTLVMIRLGRVYRGEMVAMRPTNRKLRERGAAMVARLSGCDPEKAARAAEAAGGDVKLAVLMVAGLSREEAEARLARHDGHLREAMASLSTGAAR